MTIFASSLIGFGSNLVLDTLFRLLDGGRPRSTDDGLCLRQDAAW